MEINTYEPVSLLGDWEKWKQLSRAMTDPASQDIS